MRLRAERRTRFVARSVLAACKLSLLVAAVAIAARAQNHIVANEDAPAHAPVRNVRAMLDPHNGVQWLVMSDPDHPSGPGRMIVARDAGGSPSDFAAAKSKSLPVIHPGEKVVVEEHTATVDATLDAIAVDAAALGSRMHVRLKIGGKVLRAIAIAPGRALLLTAA